VLVAKAKRGSWTASAEARWRSVFDDWRRSGLGVRAFCRRRGVSEHSFYVWRKRLADSDEPTFLPVRVVEEPKASIEVRISNAVISVQPGFDRKLLADVVAALGTSRC
jgi:transposase-like protein